MCGTWGSYSYMDVFDVNIENKTYSLRTTINSEQWASNVSAFKFNVSTVIISITDSGYLTRSSTYTLVGSPNQAYTISNIAPEGSDSLNSNYLKWQIAPNQFTLTDTDNLMFGEVVLGATGVITGTLCGTKSLNFDDNFSKFYVDAQEYYDTLEPVVLQDGDTFGTENTYIIPTKSDGTSLLDISNMTDTSSLFSNQTKIVEICALDTSNVTNASSMFNVPGSTNNLKRIKGPLDLSNCTNAGRIFVDCRNLEYINNSNEWTFDFSMCTDLNVAFRSTKVKKLNLTDTSLVTNFNSAFAECTNLTHITGLDLSGVSSSNVSNPLDSMFKDCENLESINSITIPSGVTSIDSMFYNCKKITNSNLPINNLPSSVIYIPYCFYKTNITTIPNWDFSHVTSAASTFSNTKLTGSITLNLNSAVNIQGIFSRMF